MSLNIPANDHGKIRVFAVDAPVEGLLEKTPDALRETFGVSLLNIDFVDVLDLADLTDEMHLLDYIAQGYDVAMDEADVAALSGLGGVVVFIMSRAHEGKEITLELGNCVRQVTTLGRGARMTVAARIDTESSAGVIGTKPVKPPKSDARIGGMVATVALLVMFALVGVMVWIGG